jgi:potassium-transporting ATPase KdpC subunit
MSKFENLLNILKKHRLALQPAFVIALVSLLACGLIYPLVITGIGQAFFPYQANGEILTINGTAVGSQLIAQNFTSPMFFHPRNDSASGVDPDITLQDAYSQIDRIHNATGISRESLTELIDQNQDGSFLTFGNPYVNVLNINLKLISSYTDIYRDFR